MVELLVENVLPLVIFPKVLDNMTSRDKSHSLIFQKAKSTFLHYDLGILTEDCSNEQPSVNFIGFQYGAKGNRFALLLLSARSNNRGSHQFLNWWQELSTGQFHLDGFDSPSYIKQ